MRENKTLTISDLRTFFSNLSSTEATAEVLEQAATLNMKRKGDADMLEEWLGCECS